MAEIVLPDGRRVDVSEPTVYEQQMLQALAVIGRQLDVLIKLECGYLKRADLKRDLIEATAAIQALHEEEASGEDRGEDVGPAPL